MSQGHGRPTFTVLVGNFPYGSDPSNNDPAFQNPPPTRQAIAYDTVTTV